MVPKCNHWLDWNTFTQGILEKYRFTSPTERAFHSKSLVGSANLNLKPKEIRCVSSWEIMVSATGVGERSNNGYLPLYIVKSNKNNLFENALWKYSCQVFRTMLSFDFASIRLMSSACDLCKGLWYCLWKAYLRCILCILSHHRCKLCIQIWIKN